MQILHERKHSCFMLKINLVHSLSTYQSTKKGKWQWGFASVLNWYMEKSGVSVLARNTKLVMNSCQGIQLNLKVFYCKPSEWVSQLTLVVEIVNCRPEIVTQDGFADLKYSLGRQKCVGLCPANIRTFLPTSFHLDSQGCETLLSLKLLQIKLVLTGIWWLVQQNFTFRLSWCRWELN